MGALQTLEWNTLTDEPVDVRVQEVDGTDPTDGTGALAFMRGGAKPAGGDYVAGTWVTDTDQVPTQYWLRASPSSPLSRGEYHVWLKLSLDGDVVQRPVLLLNVE